MWIWAAGQVKHRYLVTGDHQGLKIQVKWDPATPNDKKVGRTIELWRDRTGREMVPMQLWTPHTEHLTGTEYTGEVDNAWPLPQPQKRNRKAPAAQGSSTSSTPDGARAGHGPPPQLPVPRNRHLRKPTPASTSSTSLR